MCTLGTLKPGESAMPIRTKPVRVRLDQVGKAVDWRLRIAWGLLEYNLAGLSQHEWLWPWHVRAAGHRSCWTVASIVAGECDLLHRTAHIADEVSHDWLR